MLLKRLLAGALLLLAALPAQASVYIVSPTGSDSGPGTLAAPWKTLRKALTALHAGDTLYVRGGTYTENLGNTTPVTIRPGTATAPITVRSYSGERPVLKGLLHLRSPSYWTLDGLNVTWLAGNPQTQHMVKMVNGVGWSVLNAEIWGANSFAGILVASTVAGQPASWRIAYNTIHDILTVPLHHINGDQCIYVNTHDTPGGVIEHNLLYNATNGMGVKLGSASVDEPGPANVIVRYNTIFNTSQSILVAWSAHNNQITRNLMQRVGAKYWCIRGYQLTGAGNVASDNAGYEAKGMFLNDAGYVGVGDDGGNVFPLDPLFDALTPSGFHPLNPAAQSYGWQG